MIRPCNFAIECRLWLRYVPMNRLSSRGWKSGREEWGKLPFLPYCQWSNSFMLLKDELARHWMLSVSGAASGTLKSWNGCCKLEKKINLCSFSQPAQYTLFPFCWHKLGKKGRLCQPTVPKPNCKLTDYSYCTLTKVLYKVLDKVYYTWTKHCC